MEDVQKRLLSLGFDLGPTGVDGVFLGATLAAVRRFQQDRALAEDGVVGDETWSALVDATFRLGDRLLYLKHPHLHGADVGKLQGALNVLGFACGEPDGIFGTYTERAVREFQMNAGLPQDGIAGPDTVGAIDRLRHVWSGKDPASPAALAVAPARAAEVLRAWSVSLVCADERARAIAGRVANLAKAAEAGARIRVIDESAPDQVVDGLVLRLCCPGCETPQRVPVIAVDPDLSAEGRFIAAFRAADPGSGAVVNLPEAASTDEHTAQTVAVRILDGVCAVLSGEHAAVLP